MQPNIDSEILRQLTRIADAANRPAPSPWLEWLRTLASFSTGLLAAYLGLQIQSRFADRREKKRMRSAMYRELAKSYCDLARLVHGKPTNEKYRVKVLTEVFTFDGEKYMQDNRATFLLLEEGEILKWMYNWFHRIEPGNRYGLSELKGPLRFFSERYLESQVLQKNFKKFANRGDFMVINQTVSLYNKPGTMEELVDSGLLEIEDLQAMDINKSGDRS